MKLLPQDQVAADQALRGVLMAAETCVQQPDIESTREALSATWRAVLRAQHELNDAEANARSAARRKLDIMA